MHTEASLICTIHLRRPIDPLLVLWLLQLPFSLSLVLCVTYDGLALIVACTRPRRTTRDFQSKHCSVCQQVSLCLVLATTY